MILLVLIMFNCIAEPPVFILAEGPSNPILLLDSCYNDFQIWVRFLAMLLSNDVELNPGDNLRGGEST